MDLVPRSRPGVLRPMTPADVPTVVAGQEPAAVLGLGDVFPQDLHPFPRADITARWHAELADPAVGCYVVVDDGGIEGFVALRDDELLHFGITVDHWGTGLARQAHDEALDLLRAAGVTSAWLWVFTGNGRGRRFYENLGWAPTGETSHTTFPPHPELLHYARPL